MPPSFPLLCNRWFVSHLPPINASPHTHLYIFFTLIQYDSNQSIHVVCPFLHPSVRSPSSCKQIILLNHESSLHLLLFSYYYWSNATPYHIHHTPQYTTPYTPICSAILYSTSICSHLFGHCTVYVGNCAAYMPSLA
jgi:hypothetical protein